jgi:hypothetical protein
MKKLFAAIVAVVALGAAQPAQAQFKFGLTGGLNITDMKFSGDAVSKDNREGFFIGPKVKFTLPVIGLAIDASAVYDQRSFKSGDETVKQKYINIPINVRYGIGLGSVADVFLFAGPQFGFNLSKSKFLGTNEWTWRGSNFSVNVGIGFTVLGKVEVKANYNVACGKTGEVNEWDATKTTIKQTFKSKYNSWQVGLAYYF